MEIKDFLFSDFQKIKKIRLIISPMSSMVYQDGPFN